MADNTLKTDYTIELSIKNADKVNSRIDAMDRALSDVSKNAKNLDFKSALDSVKNLEKSMMDLAKSGEDCTKDWAEFDRVSVKAYKDLESAAVMLNHSLSEQGRIQRDRIKELEEEKSKLGKTKEEKAKARAIDKELKELRKQVVDLSDEELKDALKANTTARAHLKLLQQEARIQKQQTKEQKTLTKLIKEDLKPLRDKLSLMKQYIKSLQTTEGKYKALKSLAKGAFAVGKTMGKGTLAVGGGLMALGGMAMAGADRFAAREHEADRVKGGGSKDEKIALLGELYARTGADDSSIVDAINRVYAVLGNVSKTQLVEAATAEIRMPGLAALFRQQNTEPVDFRGFTAYYNRMKSQQSMTGASIEQISSSSDYIANLKQNSFANSTIAELQALYLALQNSGAFDSEDELKRAFESFVRTQKNSDKSVFELAKEWNWARTQYGATNRTQVANTIKNLDWSGLEASSKVVNGSRISETAAEATARRMRELNDKKDQILIKVLEALYPVIESIDKEAMEKFFQNLLTFITETAPVVAEILKDGLSAVGGIVKVIGDLASSVQDLVTWLQSKEINLWGDDDSIGLQDVAKGMASPLWGAVSLGKKAIGALGYANGGVASVPSIFGEAGPEMAIPLSPERSGRASQLVAYVNNAFNMQGSETTAMSLANALNSREFAFQSGRIGQLNRRMGR